MYIFDTLKLAIDFLSNPFPPGGHPPDSVFYVASCIFTVPITAILLVFAWRKTPPLISRGGWTRFWHLRFTQVLFIGLLSGLFLQSAFMLGADTLVLPLLALAFLYYPALVFFLLCIIEILIEMCFMLLARERGAEERVGLKTPVAVVLFFCLAFIVIPSL